jgi:hypothetical protein
MTWRPGLAIFGKRHTQKKEHSVPILFLLLFISGCADPLFWEQEAEKVEEDILANTIKHHVKNKDLLIKEKWTFL